MIRSIRRGLATLAVVAASFLATHPASAQVVTDCAGAIGQSGGSDVLVVDHNATCNLGTVAITAKHAISIQADGPITGGNITLLPASNANGTGTYPNYGAIYINGQSSISLGNILATPDDISAGGDIVINAGTTLKAGTITTSLGGYIVLESQKSGGNVPFVIGTSGTNGVGKLSTTGNNLSQFTGLSYLTMDSTLVYVVNGNSSSNGGITLTADTDLAVTSGGGSRGGGIILNAQNGPIKIPAGTISVAGGTNIGGGSITLLASAVNFTGTTTLNADGLAPATFDNQIVISAATVAYTTLTLESDGNGVPVQSGVPLALPSAVFLQSQGQYMIQDTQTLDSSGRLSVLMIFVQPSNMPVGSLALNGTGALTAHASGNLDQVAIIANPITINGTNVSLTSTGATNHGVYIGGAGGGVTFGNTGTVTLDAHGTAKVPSPTTAGGYVYVSGDNVALNAKTYTINANGPTTGAGDGGIVDLEASSLLSTGPAFLGAKVTANGATAGAGNAQTALVVPALDPMRQFPAINIAAGNTSNLTFGTGTTLGTFNLAATGGKTGDGGKVVVNAGNMTVLNVLSSINASALDTASDAGSINLTSVNPTSPSVTFTYSTAPVIAVKAIGGTASGMGGAVVVNVAKLSQVSTNFDVNGTIKVDGGTNLTPSENDGSISLNSILCQQTPTSNAPVWPAAFWDCTAQTGLYQSPAAVTASSISATARGKAGLTTRLRIYVFNQIGDYTTFFLGSPPVEAGETFQATTTTSPNIYSSVWLQNPAQGGGTFSDTTLREITIHEIGHGFDYFLGQSKQSGATTYNTFAVQ